MLRAYIVFRPYCEPSPIVVLATSNKHAVQKAQHGTWGYSEDAHARLLKENEAIGISSHEIKKTKRYKKLVEKSDEEDYVEDVNDI